MSDHIITFPGPKRAPGFSVQEILDAAKPGGELNPRIAIAMATDPALAALVGKVQTILAKAKPMRVLQLEPDSALMTRIRTAAAASGQSVEKWALGCLDAAARACSVEL
jgi:hypothetical protein